MSLSERLEESLHFLITCSEDSLRYFTLHWTDEELIKLMQLRKLTEEVRWIVLNKNFP